MWDRGHRRIAGTMRRLLGKHSERQTPSQNAAEESEAKLPHLSETTPCLMIMRHYAPASNGRRPRHAKRGPRNGRYAVRPVGASYASNLLLQTRCRNYGLSQTIEVPFQIAHNRGSQMPREAYPANSMAGPRKATGIFVSTVRPRRTLVAVSANERYGGRAQGGAAKPYLAGCD